MFARAFRCIEQKRTVAFSHSHVFSIVSFMKAFSASLLALASFTLLSACSAQQASVTDTDWTMAAEAVSSYGGPYLEVDEENEDIVELHIHSSSSSVQP